MKYPAAGILAIPFQKSKDLLTILEPARKGLNGQFHLINIQVSGVRVSGKKGTVRFTFEDPFSIAKSEEEIIGSWICFPKELLKDQKDLFVFQLIGMKIFCNKEEVGTVQDYFETGAHGVLTIEMKDGIEVMVPYVDEFVFVDLAGGKITIDRLYEFIV